MLYLFDIDGTLIGGDGSGRRAFERACQDRLGIPGALEHIRLDGMTDPLILDSVFRLHHDCAPTPEEARAVFEVYVRHLADEVAAGLYHVKPAVPETLDHLEARGAIIGLATGNLEAGARIKLTRGDLWRRFAFGGFGDDAPATTDGRAEMVRAAIRRGVARAGRTFMRDEILGHRRHAQGRRRRPRRRRPRGRRRHRLVLARSAALCRRRRRPPDHGGVARHALSYAHGQSTHAEA